MENRSKTEHRLIDAFKSGKVYALSCSYCTLAIGLYGITFWLPTIVEAFGMTDYLEVGLVTAIPYGVSVVGMIFVSRHSDKTGERRLHSAPTCLWARRDSCRAECLRPIRMLPSFSCP